MTDSTELKRHAAKVLRRLQKTWPDADCSLDFRTPLQLLVSTILSAQCTDERVNLVTRDLFKKYRSAADYATVPLDELKEDIRSTGFFNNKAKNIQACCRTLMEEYNGEVPADLDTLVALPGIGRKTANVILGTGFGIASGVVVDTHVGRVSRRLGLTEHNDKNAVKIEQDLMQLFPEKEWIALSHRMINLGRSFCMARKPNCADCPMNAICPKVDVKT